MKKDALAIRGSTGLATSPPPISASRKKGPTQRTVVDRVVDEKSGFGVDVIFDRKKGLFEASVPGYPQEIIDDTIGPVLKKAREVLRATREYQWKASIVIDIGDGGPFWEKGQGQPDLREVSWHCGGCRITQYKVDTQFKFYRLEIAPKPGDPSRFVCRPHVEDVTDPEGGYRRDAEDRLRGNDVGDFLERARAVVIPYSPEAWTGIKQVSIDIRRMLDKLRELVRQPEALAAGARLLPPAKAPVPALPPAKRRR